MQESYQIALNQTRGMLSDVDFSAHDDILFVGKSIGTAVATEYAAQIQNIPIWLDVSMKRFEYVHPAGGNEYTSVMLTPEELEKVSGAVGWCDVCKGWDTDEEV